jgi:lipoprotein-anchoring transpeptidase ErfK/SrfK
MAVRHHRPTRRVLTGAVSALALLALAGCGGTPSAGPALGEKHDSPSSSPTPTPAVSITSNVKRDATDVRVNRMVELSATDGTFRKVLVHSLKGEKVPGGFNAAQTRWTATSRLEPGKKYVVQAVAEDSEGMTKTFSSRFSTANLSLDEQTYPSISPLDGSTVGVGMPIMIHFDVPVADRKNFQKHMKVTSSAGQKGRFYWIDDQNVHYRPPHYWKPGSTINVDVAVNSVSAGNGIYGQEDRKVSFTVGRSMVSKVNTQTDQMKVFRDGKLLRTIPITTGQQPKFTTRSGIKVIVEKFRHKRMNSETIGIDPNSADGYDLDDVEYAMRVTYSGEFVHAAPWSVASQGRARVSHGCVGMSTPNAIWLFNQTHVGDIVQVVGSPRHLEPGNGWTDWNVKWSTWLKGSAL